MKDQTQLPFFSAGQDLPLFSGPPRDPSICPECDGLLCDVGTPWQFCPDCHEDNDPPERSR
jgi:hypothetical protein